MRAGRRWAHGRVRRRRRPGVAVIALADAPRETSAKAVSDLHELGMQVVMLSGDSQAIA